MEVSREYVIAELEGCHAELTQAVEKAETADQLWGDMQRIAARAARAVWRAAASEYLHGTMMGVLAKSPLDGRRRKTDVPFNWESLAEPYSMRYRPETLTDRQATGLWIHRFADRLLDGRSFDLFADDNARSLEAATYEPARHDFAGNIVGRFKDDYSQADWLEERRWEARLWAECITAGIKRIHEREGEPQPVAIRVTGGELADSRVLPTAPRGRGDPSFRDIRAAKDEEGGSSSSSESVASSDRPSAQLAAEREKPNPSALPPQGRDALEGLAGWCELLANYGPDARLVESLKRVLQVQLFDREDCLFNVMGREHFELKELNERLEELGALLGKIARAKFINGRWTGPVTLGYRCGALARHGQYIRELLAGDGTAGQQPDLAGAWSDALARLNPFPALPAVPSEWRDHLAAIADLCEYAGRHSPTEAIQASLRTRIATHLAERGRDPGGGPTTWLFTAITRSMQQGQCLEFKELRERLCELAVAFAEIARRDGAKTLGERRDQIARHGEYIRELLVGGEGAVGQQPSSATEPPHNITPAHSDDFRSVNWFGARYDFTPNQAACVKVLWEHWERGGLSVGAQTLLEAADLGGSRLDVVFRDSPARGTMIVRGSKRGTFRLAGPGQKTS